MRRQDLRLGGPEGPPSVGRPARGPKEGKRVRKLEGRPKGEPKFPRKFQENGQPSQEEMANRLQRAMERLQRVEGSGGVEGSGDPEVLRREMEELRAGIRMREEKMKEMHRHVEELEDMLRKMKEEAGAKEEKR